MVYSNSPIVPVLAGAFSSRLFWQNHGCELAELAGKEFAQGRHTLEFSIKNLSAGSYFYVIEAGGFSATRKMTVPTP